MKKLYLFLFASVFVLGAAAQTWTFQAPMNAPKGQHAVVSHPNGNAYVFGGFAGGSPINTLQIYNASTNTWTAGAALQFPVRGHSFVLGPDSNIYCFSGTNSAYSPSCFRYSVINNTWSPITNIPTPCWESSAATVAGMIYVIGGENAEGLVQVYNPANDSWSSGAPVPTPVLQHTCVAANGKIYVMGGTANSITTDIVQIYDPALNTWSTGATMPGVRDQFAGMLGPDGKIYAVGGKNNYGNNQSPFFATTFIYDPIGDSWTTGPNMPKGLGETEGCAIGNNIYVFGGADSSGNYSNVTLKMQITSTGVPDETIDLISLFPNPANNQLFLNTNGIAGTLRLSILDITGKIIADRKIEAGYMEMIDISELIPGIYFVDFTVAGNKITKKFIVQ
jgi:N-acetylneuraminic acid mutarotase